MAPDKYKNFCTYLNPNPNLEILSTKESLKETKVFSFKCKTCDNTSNFAQASFSNKMSIMSPHKFCAHCTRVDNDKNKFNDAKKEIFEKTKHVLLTCDFGGDRKCTYTCANCERVGETTLHNLSKNTGFCPKCQNDKNRLEFTDVRDNVKLYGFVLNMKNNEYTNNKNLIVKCKCGNPNFKVSLSDLKRGRLCTECKMGRIFDSGVQFKDYTFPSGKTVKIQGYEWMALDYMLSDKYKNSFINYKITEDDILVGKQIGYINYTYKNGVHKYYPDFKIKNTNVYIEVKSTYTLDTKWEINMAKFMGTADSDFKLQVLIFNATKLVQVFEYEKNNVVIVNQKFV